MRCDCSLRRNLNIQDVFWMNQVQMRKRVVGGGGLKAYISSLVNARDLQLECVRVLHETFLVTVLTYARRQC